MADSNLIPLEDDMTAPAPGEGLDPEILAITQLYTALQPLDREARGRVLAFVSAKLGMTIVLSPADKPERQPVEQPPGPPPAPTPIAPQVEDPGTEGISPVALKWMRRNGLSVSGLSEVFSLGLDEIDLVAKQVPGENKKERMHSVLLLKAIAAYLSSGAARVGHEQVKEACLHYDAYDGSNFAAYLKSFASEVGGSKESGYTLSAKGISAATDLIKRLAPGRGENK